MSDWRNPSQPIDETSESFRAGQKLGETLAKRINSYLLPRLEELEINLLRAFRQRLSTFNEHPNEPPRLLAIVELRLFIEHLEGLAGRIVDETAMHLPDVIEISDITDTKEDYVQYVSSLSEQAAWQIFDKAKYMASGAVSVFPGAEPLDPEYIDSIINRSAFSTQI